MYNDFVVTRVEGTKRTKVNSRSKEAFISAKDTSAAKHLLVIFVNPSQKIVVVYRSKGETVAHPTGVASFEES